jgi:hypothetical protein
MIKKEAEMILRYKDLTTEIQRLWNVKKDKGDTSNYRGNRNRLKILQKIPEQHTGKARSQGTAENSHIGRCTGTAGSRPTNVKVQNIQHGK